jgi:putative two-component system response regulator
MTPMNGKPSRATAASVPPVPVAPPLRDDLTETKPQALIDTVREIPTEVLTAAARKQSEQLARTMVELVRTRDFLVQSLAEVVGNRLAFTSSRGPRLQRLCGILCAEASKQPIFKDELTSEFVLLLSTWIPLLDVGYLLMHDSFLLKPGRLTPDEREKMQEHTILGADLLARIASKQPQQMAFYHMPIAIARYHHERYDGTGYPDQLVGMEIPLAARIVAICDVYDAMRSQRSYKPSLSHSKTMKLMLAEPGHFDPHLLEAFFRCAGKFDGVYLGDSES